MKIDREKLQEQVREIHYQYVLHWWEQSRMDRISNFIKVTTYYNIKNTEAVSQDTINRIRKMWVDLEKIVL
jgi:hypothetical protein